MSYEYGDLADVLVTNIGTCTSELTEYRTHDTEESTPSLEPPPTHTHMSTPGDTFFGSFFDRYFFTGGTLNTPPPPRYA